MAMDLPSDSDESDVDFVPDNEEVVSEAESEDADKETDAQYEDELVKKNIKRGAQQSKKKRKKAKVSNDEDSPSKSISEKPVDPEKEKKYEDDLWASFLDTPSASKPSTEKKGLKIEESSAVTKENIRSEKSSDNKKLGSHTETKTVDDLFKTLDTESSSKIVNKIAVIKDDVKVSPGPRLPIPGPRKSGGGLASVLNKLGKKDKLSTLEKTKLDWMSFKKEEGIEEDISIHNRGRNGYLERQDFLQRTDVNQFEIEKDLRTNKRSNR